MSILFALAAAATALPPLPDRASAIRCVAALAIVANEQERSVGDWDDLPPVKAKGIRFAKLVEKSAIAETGQSEKQVRGAILAEVAKLQKDSAAADDADQLTRAVVDPCVAMMDKLTPDLPPPSLPQCAGMIALARDAMQRQEPGTEPARQLALIASVLDSRARDALKAGGKSGTEIDVALQTERETIAARGGYLGDNEAEAEAAIDACYELAAPNERRPH